jgi:hypothetical protein
MPAKDAVPVRPLVLVPAVITLAVTLLRLFGELKGWSPALFNRQAGGGGALVGIAWLVFFFGAYFAWKLLDEGHSPETAWRPLGYGVLGLAIALIPLIGAQALHLPPLGVFVVFVVASLAALFVAMKGWPALGRTLVAYGLAARIPVVVVMLIAMPPMGPLQKWFWIGVVPQLTTWMGFTVVFGMIFGGIVAAARLRRRAVAA